MGLFFLQDTHSTIHDAKKWNEEFKGKRFFSHGQSNSCGVAIGFTSFTSFGFTSFEASNKKQDGSSRIKILDVKVSDNGFLLINLYNANTESEQLNTLSTLCDLLDDEARDGNPEMKN